jgi:hypothetical protein
MEVFQLLFNYAGSFLLAAIVLGLVIRRRSPFCRCFLFYAAWVLTSHVVIANWPHHFFNIAYFMVSETVVFAAKVLIAVEIAHKSFSALARARPWVSAALAGVLLATALTEWLASAVGLNDFGTFVGIVNPRRQAGTLVMFAVVVAAVSWYRIPLHPLHRAILIGFAVYQVVNTAGSCLYVWYGEQARTPFLALNGITYIGAASWWVYAAWRRRRAPDPIVCQLLPWAHSW